MPWKNGWQFGTKGCSLAPYFAYQLVENLLHGSEIDPEASWTRFQ